jgi:ABC-2 type transport system ATP-binding protein
VLIGPNGAGKTTLLHTLLGFYPAAGGTARVLGRDIRSQMREVRALLGYMPESDAFIAGLSGVRFVRLMAELSGLPREQAIERAHEALFYVGLGEARYRTVDSYSLGMKQLAKLAQALVHGPKVLFLDEPTNGLDPPARERMIRLIRDIRDAGDVRVILSSHLLRDVEECCEEVLVLKQGQIAVYCDLEAERRGNRKFLELEIRGEEEGVHASFAAEMEKLGCEVAEGARQRLKLVMPDSVEIRDLYRLAAERQVQIRRLDYKRDSLEDIFLKAMEGSGDGRL